ncbi:hypothetical protein NGA_0459300 [Nannochloropsis gaditana CCMP526]|nr:hypothetical protein NGA_0459300 [Nannochloropsis gaditana CCMP526]EKU22450.1 hypothetical protein NGA_0459300 [Nannochloropsis gaditana CCMP526]|eukprot:XP_005853910.1 hypothetical protein NGA_0459300 [Nannochloropsis gaditana CCMP526]
MDGGTDEQRLKRTKKNVPSSNKIIDAKQKTEEEETVEHDDDADKHCSRKDGGWGNNDFQRKQDEGDSDIEAEGKELELLVDEDGRLVFDGGHVDYSFRSFPAAFPSFCTDATSSSVLSTLLHDCRVASTARAQAKAGGDYSEGETFFITADTKPKVQLEALALSIFWAHTSQATYTEGHSGAEWWVQVLEEEDDIGLHFDKDYALEAHGLNIYPHLATVTYLSSLGGPTLVLPLSGPLHVGEDLSGALSGAWLSLPAVGKHTVFDGRLLHAAPAELRGLWADEDGWEEGGRAERKGGRKRVTLLVNVWLNHIPNGSERPSPSLLQALSPCDSAAPLECRIPLAPPFQRGDAEEGTISSSLASPGASQVTEVTLRGGAVGEGAAQRASWRLGGEAKQRYKVSILVPAEEGRKFSREDEGSTVRLMFKEGVTGMVVREVGRKGKRKRVVNEGEEEEEEEEEDDDDNDDDDEDEDEEEDGDDGEEDDGEEEEEEEEDGIEGEEDDGEEEEEEEEEEGDKKKEEEEEEEVEEEEEEED